MEKVKPNIKNFSRKQYFLNSVNIIQKQRTHVSQSSSHTFGSFYLRKTLSAVHYEFCSIGQQLLKMTAQDKNIIRCKTHIKLLNLKNLLHLINHSTLNVLCNISNLIVSFWKGDSWEQITGDSIKQWNIMRQKLGFIHVLYGAQELNKTIFRQN